MSSLHFILLNTAAGHFGEVSLISIKTTAWRILDVEAVCSLFGLYAV